MRRSTTHLAFSAVLCVTACGDDGSPADGEDDSTDTSADDSATTPSDSSTDISATAPTTADDSSTSEADSSTSSSGAADSSTTAGEGSSSETGEETMAVSVQFAANIGGEPWVCGQTYGGVGTPPTEVEPRDLRFFVQDVQLVRASDGEAVPLVLDVVAPWQAETVAMLDFEDASGACADAGGNVETNTVVTGVVPQGEYDGLRFTVGVPEDLNHEDPLVLPAPLTAGSMTWGWLYGFKFIKVEVQEVVEEPPFGGGTFHLGSNGCTGMPAVEEVTCALPNRAEIELETFDVATDSVVLDVGALFAETNITEDTQCHSFQAECAPLFDRVGVDLETGLPSPTQVVFDVE